MRREKTHYERYAEWQRQYRKRQKLKKLEEAMQKLKDKGYEWDF